MYNLQLQLQNVMADNLAVSRLSLWCIWSMVDAVCPQFSFPALNPAIMHTHTKYTITTCSYLPLWMESSNVVGKTAIYSANDPEKGSGQLFGILTWTQCNMLRVRKWLVNRFHFNDMSPCAKLSPLFIRYTILYMTCSSNWRQESSSEAYIAAGLQLGALQLLWLCRHNGDLRCGHHTFSELDGLQLHGMYNNACSSPFPKF